MTLTELAQGFGLEPLDASNRLWHLGIAAEPNTHLTGKMLSAAREYLASISVQQRSTSQPSKAPADGVVSNAGPAAPEKAIQRTQTERQPRSEMRVSAPRGPLRVFDLAQKTGIPTESIIQAAKRVGIQADHVYRLTDADIQAVWLALESIPVEGISERRVAKGVKRRRRVQSN